MPIQLMLGMSITIITSVKCDLLVQQLVRMPTASQYVYYSNSSPSL